MVDKTPIYRYDWGLVYHCFNHITVFVMFTSFRKSRRIGWTCAIIPRVLPPGELLVDIDLQAFMTSMGRQVVRLDSTVIV